MFCNDLTDKTHPSKENNPFDLAHDPIEDRIAIGLSNIHSALKSSAWNGASQQGLTPTQGEILRILRSNGDSEMRLSEVAEGLGVTSATASDSVSVLVEKNLVFKQRSSQDARALAITLTDEGKREADIVANWPRTLINSLGELSLAEQEAFLQGLIKIVGSLQKQGLIPFSRMCLNCRFFRPNVYQDTVRPHHCAFVDAPFGTRHLQMDCPDHELADSGQSKLVWNAFLVSS